MRRRLNKRSQVGQSVIMLAIALLMLIAFVGLVTDIALLFVRFSTLRRAVDSAAIAAAGQIREDSNYLKMVQAAYQFIELHGIGVTDINQIFVETCDTTPGDPELCPASETELPRKLVRVTAQIESPTTFLSLLGLKTIILEAAAVGETAVIDMALVLDTSESMSELTCYGDPPVGTDEVNCYGVNDYADADLELDVADRVYPLPPGDTVLATSSVYRFSWGGPRKQYDTYPNDQNWGYYCNDPNGDGYFDDLVCNPFKNVRTAAANFIDRMDFVRGDRVAVVTFDRYALVRYADCEYTNPFSPQLGCKNTVANGYTEDQSWSGYPMISDKQTAREILIGDITHTNPMRRGVGVYVQQDDDAWFFADKWDYCWINADDERSLAEGGAIALYTSGDISVVAQCGNTNLGGGIEVANSVLAGGSEGRWKNPASVWVMVLLTDGAANASIEYPEIEVTYPFGFCPDSTIAPFLDLDDDAPLCRDKNAFTRHIYDDDGDDGVMRYDADDYARDRADMAGLADKGNFIAMFAIGLGKEMIDGSPATQPWHGEALLRYIADVGDNGVRDGTGDRELLYNVDSGDYEMISDPNPASASECENIPHGDYSKFGTDEWKDPSCGNYFFAPDPNNLEPIFAEIASRMFTRVTR
jgi:hypothetical protein